MNPPKSIPKHPQRENQSIHEQPGIFPAAVVVVKERPGEEPPEPKGVKEPSRGK